MSVAMVSASGNESERVQVISHNKKAKLALMTNMIAPYRIPLYSALADHFDLLILHGGQEANRDSWTPLDDALPNARVVRAWGWQIPYDRRINGQAFDRKFIHVTPGFIWHLLRFRPDAVLSNEMGFRSAVAVAYGTIFRKPVWIGWGGTLHSERNIGPFRKGLRKLFTLQICRWITYGEASTEYLLRLGVRRDRILQSQNSVDEKRFKVPVKPAWNINPRPVVLHVGQFIERKGIASLLNVAARLQQEGHEFSLLLVGSGPDKRAVERRAQNLGLKNAHFYPAQLPDRMPAVYRSADLMVFPTFEDVWGLVANEAILSGVPVLCSRYAGCASELFPPENTFSPDDLNEFSQKLILGISGRLPKTDPLKLRTTQQLGSELVSELNRFLPGPPILGSKETSAVIQ